MTKVLITREQYNSLSPIGVELHRYWMTFKSEEYNEMAAAGTLWEVLQCEDKRLAKMVADLITVNGMSENMAMEVARAEIYNKKTIV